MGIFALALILPLLLLACGGSDEPTDLPDSERATVEPESRASSGQTTTVPKTESAEPSPTPRATAAPTPAATAVPTMVRTSSETDREALIALYNATGGPHWRYSNHWRSDVPISEWEGVIIDDNGRVTELFLGGNQLSGEIPPELGKLTSLTLLRLGGNQLSGEIPPELGNLARLNVLFLSGNQFTGCVPSSLSGRLNMEYSELRGLQFCP